MRIYFRNKKEIVEYVEDRLESLNKDSALTMTIIPGQFGDFSARIVIEGLLEDTDETKAQNSLKQPTNISPKNTRDG